MFEGNHRRQGKWSQGINKQREEITMRVLEDMEKGGNEWKKPWVEASPLPPHNPVSGTQYAENYKDAPDNVIEKKIWPHDDEGNYYCSVRVYRLSYLAIDDRGTEYMITMEYIKSNEANPEEIGLNYVSIFKTDPDSDEIIRAGRTWE